MKFIIHCLLIGVTVALQIPVRAAELPPAPATFCWDGPSLQAIRTKSMAHDASVAKVMAIINRDANEALRQEIQAVTDKTFLAPSGDRHDYVSLSPYFWPDPAKTNGLPYVVRDGETNPEAAKYDSRRLGKACHNIEALALAYYLTGREQDADRAIHQLRCWFLDPKTRMNPNLKYAQMVKGKNQGSRWGIIDTWPLIHVVDAVALLSGSQSWTPADSRGMKQWFADYLDWLRTSDLGQKESAANNNHSVYYDLQVADFALFTGQTNLAREVLASVGPRRIQSQIEPDGSLPLELARTKSLSYTLFNLSGFLTLARLGEHVDVDLWHYRTADGRGLRGALDWMTPYATGQKKWTHQQIIPQTYAPMVTLWHQAAIAFRAPVYEAMIPQVKDAGEERVLNQLFSSTPNPVLQVARWDQERILRLARQALSLKPLAITDEVATNSPGGPHDYFSQADYAWPNSTNRSGLPYVIRDGESNPNTFSGHRLALRQLKDAIASLGAAYALTGDDRYAFKAAQLLKVFLLDPATRMSPNLPYAQSILGVSTGTPYGIIDTLHLAEVAQAIRFLEKSPSFPPSVAAGLKQWFTDYSHWIMTSPNGQLEMHSANNHSMACYLQLAAFARLTGDEAVLKLARKQFMDVLLPGQMTNNGSFSRELARTKPYGYSIFQADNVAALCELLSTTNQDFWQLTLADGRTPRMAVDFIYPYLADKNRWLADGYRSDVAHWDCWPVRQPCLILGFAEFGDQNYFDLWKKLEPDPTDLEVQRNLAITQPLLWLAHPEDAPLLPQPTP